MKGIIEKIWENKDKKGEKYWVIAIDGQRYSVWDENLMKNLSEGDLIEFLWKKSGRFRNITKIEKLPEKQALALQEEKSKQIIRMSCIRSAAEILARVEIDPEEKVNKVIKIAKQFEDHVLYGD
jgi:hypothetical protein